MDLISHNDAKEVTNSKPQYYIQPDIQPYQSMVDGTMITSRSKHREHLKQHGCIEVGNETKYLKKHGEYKPEGQRQAIIESMRKKGFL